MTKKKITCHKTFKKKQYKSELENRNEMLELGKELEIFKVSSKMKANLKVIQE